MLSLPDPPPWLVPELMTLLHQVQPQQTPNQLMMLALPTIMMT
jgi:hypothetical protein